MSDDDADRPNVKTGPKRARLVNLTNDRQMLLFSIHALEETPRLQTSPL